MSSANPNNSMLQTAAGIHSSSRKHSVDTDSSTEATSRLCIADLGREDLSGLSIAQYKLGRRIGQGGMGQVFEATHMQLGKKFAIKFIRAELQCEEAKQRFLSEITALGKLNHRHLVNAVDAGQSDRLLYCVTELLQGNDLYQLVKQRGPLPLNEAASLVRQAALGLGHAHDLGLIHRDIKPNNLFLEVDGTLKVLDFGIARHTSRDDVMTQAGQMLGTVDFMSPEQIADARQASVQSDLYSLGAVLVYLLSGETPYPDRHYPSLVNKVTAITTLTPEFLKNERLPQSFRSLLLRLLASDSTQRFGSAAELANALADFTGKEVAKTSLEAEHIAGTQRAPAARRNKELLGAVVGSGMAIAGIALFVSQPNRNSAVEKPLAPTSTIASEAPEKNEVETGFEEAISDAWSEPNSETWGIEDRDTVVQAMQSKLDQRTVEHKAGSSSNATAIGRSYKLIRSAPDQQAKGSE